MQYSICTLKRKSEVKPIEKEVQHKIDFEVARKRWSILVKDPDCEHPEDHHL